MKENDQQNNMLFQVLKIKTVHSQQHNPTPIITLRPGQNNHHFVDGIFIFF